MRRALVLLPLAAVLLSACSGSGSGTSLKDQRAAYLKKAEAVCKQANDQAAGLQAPSSVAEVPAFADRSLQLVRTTVDRFAAVAPPPDDAAQVRSRVTDRLQADAQTVAGYVDQVKAAAAANDNAALLRLLQQRPRTTADLQFMRTYGFDQCVRAAQQASG